MGVEHDNVVIPDYSDYKGTGIPHFHTSFRLHRSRSVSPLTSLLSITMSNLQASHLFSVQDRVVVITGGGSGKTYRGE